jgi:hypothetical protein
MTKSKSKSEPEPLVITRKLADSLIERLSQGGDAGLAAAQWWKDNHETVIGLPIQMLQDVFRRAERAAHAQAPRLDTNLAVLTNEELLAFDTAASTRMLENATAPQKIGAVWGTLAGIGADAVPLLGIWLDELI